jgi:hypothetical protein
MNKLEGKLIRCIYKKIRCVFNINLFNHAFKLKPLSIGKRTDTNILASLLAEGVIDINDINRLGKEQWNVDYVAVVEILACIMLGACGYGTKHYNNPHLPMIHRLVSDEAATKKALNLKGWVTGFEDFGKYKVFIAISTGGDGFIFDGDGKCNYFIWDFENNNFKNKLH